MDLRVLALCTVVVVNEVVVIPVTPLEAVLFQYLPELVVAFETENLTGERRDLGLDGRECPWA